MRNQFKGYLVYSRIPGERPSGQFGQGITILFRKMFLSRFDLLFDEIVIVQQPFAGRRNRAVFICRFDEELPDLSQYFFIRSKAADEEFGSRSVSNDGMGPR